MTTQHPWISQGQKKDRRFWVIAIDLTILGFLPFCCLVKGGSLCIPKYATERSNTNGGGQNPNYLSNLATTLAT